MDKTLDRDTIESVIQTATVLNHHLDDTDTVFVSKEGKQSLTLSGMWTFAGNVIRVVEIEANGDEIDSVCQIAGLLRNRFDDGDVEATNSGKTGLLSGLRSFADGVLSIASVVKSLPPNLRIFDPDRELTGADSSG